MVDRPALTVWNKVGMTATGIAVPALVGSFIHLVMRKNIDGSVVFFFLAWLVYLLGLLAGIWACRPGRRWPGLFPWLMAPVFLQVFFYGLFWFHALSWATGGLDRDLAIAVRQVAFVGPVLTLGLVFLGRGASTLFLVEFFCPIAIMATNA